jgi:hypothetical protein
MMRKTVRLTERLSLLTEVESLIATVSLSELVIEHRLERDWTNLPCQDAYIPEMTVRLYIEQVVFHKQNVSDMWTVRKPGRP